MPATPTEPPENPRPAWLWVSRDGVVGYANGAASQRTGLTAGRPIHDPGLSRAVRSTIAAGTPCSVTAQCTAPRPGDTAPPLQCRVIPGLGADDAFVLIGDGAAGDPVDAFEELVRLIRTELHEPLATAHATVALGKARPAETPSFDDIAGGLDHLLQDIATLIDLAALWGGRSLQSATERIDPWALLQQAWTAVEPLAAEHGVRVSFRGLESRDRPASMDGSTVWLERAFAECLEAAVRASPRDVTLEVEHRRIGTRALIVFRDCRAFERNRTPSPPEPEARPDAPWAAARDPIGLRLCRHIVSLHGGQLREEIEDGRRNLLFDLPTDTPKEKTP